MSQLKVDPHYSRLMGLWPSGQPFNLLIIHQQHVNIFKIQFMREQRLIFLMNCEYQNWWLLRYKVLPCILAYFCHDVICANVCKLLSGTLWQWQFLHMQIALKSLLVAKNRSLISTPCQKASINLFWEAEGLFCFASIKIIIWPKLVS